MAGEESEGGSNYLPAATPTATAYTWPRIGTPTGAGISAAGSGAEAFAAIAQGILAQKRAQKVAEYNAEVAVANATAQAQAAEIEAQQSTRQATITRQDEQLIQEAEAWREARQREEQGRLLGQTRAIIGASGLLMEGSPLAVYEETVRQYSLTTAAQHYQGRLQQRALEEQATQQDYAATLARAGAGERIRVGGQQAGLLRANVDDTQVTAGLLRAGAAVTKGIGTYAYQDERVKRAKAQSLLGE